MPTLVTRGAASVRGFGFAGTSPVIPDPYFNYTTLLLHGNGTNGAQNNTFLDSSSNNFTITRNGDTTQGTFSPFSQTGWSNYFDGSGDYLNTSTSASASFNLGGGNYTVEFWLNPSALTAETRLVTVEVPSSTTVGIIMGGGGAGGSSSDVQVNQFGTGTRISAASVLTVGQWFHIAVTYNGTTSTLWINGVSKGTYAGSVYPSSNCYITIGGSINYATSNFNGYISNVRVVKGTAVYTSAFTPPTAPLTAITNTQFLTCQSNRFIDNSSNQFAITVNGNTSVQAFSPFNPTAAYSEATNGGSGYFDGSGDYLTVETAAESALNLIGTFTFEFWFYRNATGDIQLFSKGGGQNNWNTTNGIAYQALIESSTFKWQFSIGGGSLVSIDVTAPAISQWVHVAVGRDGTTSRVWVNGSSIGTSTSTPTPPSTRNIIYAAANQTGGNNVNGYMAGLRIVNGTDVYGVSNTSITVPTSPPTNITNTKLLLNFTNAGIIDNTAKNDLVTVGNAQISTSVSKFGGGSMYFDGSGDYVQTFASNPNLQFGTGDFTVEGWVYFNTSGQHGILQISTNPGGFNASNTNSIAIQRSATGQWEIYAKNSNPSASATINQSQWYHFAVVRSGTTTTFYVNGSSTITVTSDSTNYTGSYIGLGSIYTTGVPLNGYIDDLRITKGIARYTSNFTPQTSQWQDQ